MTHPEGPANALLDAASPYLRQHAHNPVDWRPWSEAAFVEARARDVPVIVSIGYATCHWCHVMAHESFEDAETAALMNERFVCVKVDREEHPEVDAIYMDAVQALTGHGGWPLNAVVDHDGRPFFAGTYFPTPAWQHVLRALDAAWRDERGRVLASAQQVSAHLARLAEPVAPALFPADPWPRLDGAVAQAYDPDHPGLSRRPKFPPSQLLGLLVARTDADAARGLTVAEAILEAMQDSGLHDRVGGGFHRYSTDEAWRVPHFEKMLYDNAQLMGVYALAGRRLGRPDLLRTAIGTADYLLRDLRVVDPDGAFIGYASAEDADDPGGEGSFYAWSPVSLAAVLPPDVAAALARAWDLAPGVPVRGPSGHLEPVASHVPHPRGADLAALAAAAGLPDVEALRASWEPWLPALRAARAARPRPERDDKVLTDVNGLALQGLALVARHAGEPRHLEATRELAAALEARHGPDGLLRMPGRPAFVTDYGHLLLGLTEAYAALGDAALIARAERVADEAIARLRAPDGGFWSTPAGRRDLIRRSREHTDNAWPAGAHALAVGLVRLATLTGARRFAEAADGVLDAGASVVARAPLACPTLLAAWRERGAPAVVIAGPADDPRTAALLAHARARALPGVGVVPTAGHEGVDWPLLAERRDLPPQALVCVGQACLLPAHEPAALDARLRDARATWSP